nr:immunoglobulin light chain junction region [Homo sapiens]
CMQGTHWPPTV